MKTRCMNIGDYLVAVGAWLMARSTLTLVMLLVGIVVIRNGMRFSAWEASVDLALAALPSASNYNSSALFSLLIAALLPETLRSGPLVTILPQVGTLVVIALIVRRRLILDTNGQASKAQRWAVIFAIGVSPIATLLMGNIGFARDWVPLLGLAMFVGARTRAVAIAGVVLAGLGNPEQTVFAIVLVLIATWSPALSNYRRLAATGLVASLVIFIPVQIWQVLSGTESRALFLIRNWHATVASFAPDAYIAVYASFSASWVIVVLWLAGSRRVGKIWPVLVGLLLGYVLMAFTTDGTRVFTIVATPLLLIGILSVVQAPEELVARSESPVTRYEGLLGLILVAGLFMPAVTWSVNAVLPATSSVGSLLGVARTLVSDGLNRPGASE